MNEGAMLATRKEKVSAALLLQNSWMKMQEELGKEGKDRYGEKALYSYIKLSEEKYKSSL